MNNRNAFALGVLIIGCGVGGFTSIGCGSPDAQGTGGKTGSASVSCGSGTASCNDMCVTLSTDNLNCGACGNACNQGEACADGACHPKDCPGADCADNQVCLNDHCTEIACVGVSCPAGQQCHDGTCHPTSCNDTPCPPGHVCLDSMCTEVACVGVTCPTGKVCAAGQCVEPGCADGKPNGSETDVDCGGSCPPCNDGSGCMTPADCASGVCSSGICQPCTTNSECASGQACLSGVCGACTDNSACDSGKACISGVCGPCSNSAQCSLGQACIKGVCGTCADNSECGPGQACVAGACTGCTESSQCSGGQVCLSGVCGPCSSTTECDFGKACISGTCGACTANAQCAQGEVCVSGACMTCMPGSYLGPGQVCVTCEAGYACPGDGTRSQCAAGTFAAAGAASCALCPAGSMANAGATACTLVEMFVSTAGLDTNPGTIDQPLATVAEAKLRVQAVLLQNFKSDITITLRGGTYPQPATLVFDAQDSPSAPYRVIYRSYPGEVATLSGGEPVGGWAPTTNSTLNPLVWEATLSDAGARELFVGDVPGGQAFRARHPNPRLHPHPFPDRTFLTLDWTLIRNTDNQVYVLPAEAAALEADNAPGKFRMAVVRLQSDNVLDTTLSYAGAELVVLNRWTQIRLGIKSSVPGATPPQFGIADAHGALEGLKTAPWRYGKDYRAFLENSLNFLDTPGEWFADASVGKIYYYPRHYEDMASVAVRRPVLTELVHIAPGAHDLTFRELEFRHTGWRGPNDDGYHGSQAGVFATFSAANLASRTDRVPSAFVIEGDRVSVRSCLFAQMGTGGVAVITDPNTQHRPTGISIDGNYLRDLAGGGVGVGCRTTVTGMGPCDSMPLDVSLTNNIVQRTGTEYDTVGIFAQFGENLTIQNNMVRDTSYTGISLGWFVWSCDSGITPCGDATKNAAIRRNDVADVMRVYDDGGGIYTLASNPGALVQENYVHDFARKTYSGPDLLPSAGLYVDWRSRSITVRDNQVAALVDGLFVQHSIILPYDLRAQDNTFTGNRFGADPANAFPDKGVTYPLDNLVFGLTKDLFALKIVAVNTFGTNPGYPNVSTPPYPDTAPSWNATVKANAGPTTTTWAQEFGRYPKGLFRHLAGGICYSLASAQTYCCYGSYQQFLDDTGLVSAQGIPMYDAKPANMSSGGLCGQGMVVTRDGQGNINGVGKMVGTSWCKFADGNHRASATGKLTVVNIPDLVAGTPDLGICP